MIKKGVTVEHLRTYLLKLPAFACTADDKKNTLLAGVKAELKEADTIHKIFDLIGEEYTTFLNYDVFNFIYDKYCPDMEHEDLKYPEYLRAYINQHNIKEFFEINPKLEKCTAAYKKLQFKLDIEPTCKIAKIVDLEPKIASILGVKPSALRLVSVEEGCVIVTFLVPAFVADAILPADKKMTTDEAIALRALSVLWVQCGDYREEVNVEELKKSTRMVSSTTYDSGGHESLQYCNLNQCLVPLVAQDEQGPPGIGCKNCHQVTQVPERGGADIPSEFEIQVSISISTRKSIGFCCSHAEEELKLYCETCSELICFKCAIRGGGHQNHRYKDLNKVFGKCEKEILSSLEPVKEQVSIMKKALEQLKTCSGEISDKQEAIERNIHGSFTRLRVKLTDRETELIGQLHQMTQSKLKSLAVQIDQIETTLAQFNTHIHFVSESLKTGNEGEVVMAKSCTVKQLKELHTQFQPDSLKPVTSADMKFSYLENFASLCGEYGQILTLDSPDPSKCHARAVVGGKSTFSLIFEGSRSRDLMKTLECELVSEITHARASCSIERRSQVQYEVSYQPTVKGKHQIHVTIGGQHIRGSPFSVSVKSTIEKLGFPILTLGGVLGPVGMAIGRGNLVVTIVGRGCISVFSPSGENLQLFSRYGSGRGECQNPLGVAIDGEGSILVVDSGNHRIQKFTADGHFLATVGTKGTEPLQFSHPSGIAFNASNNKMYVVDSGNHCVQVLNSNLTFHQDFGRKGHGKGQFSEPCGIACDSTGRVYVADSLNHRIQVFSAHGSFLKMFGKYGQGRGELNLPYFIALGVSSDTVYISETGNHRISVFTLEGHFMISFGQRGEGPGEFDFPCGLAVDDHGVVYVCDGENSRVQVF